MIYRNPVLLAKQAIAVDLISDGRLELGLGAGILVSDHHMSGVPFWGAAERVSRFAEFIQIVDDLLRGNLDEYYGKFYTIEHIDLYPPTVQKPRPPLTIATYGRRSTGVAISRADTWNTFCGAFAVGEEEYFALAALRIEMFNRISEQAGLEPSALKRSILVPRNHQVWDSAGNFERVAERYFRIGFNELVFFAPEQQDLEVSLEISSRTVPRLLQQSGS